MLPLDERFEAVLGALLPQISGPERMFGEKVKNEVFVGFFKEQIEGLVFTELSEDQFLRGDPGHGGRDFVSDIGEPDAPGNRDRGEGHPLPRRNFELHFGEQILLSTTGNFHFNWKIIKIIKILGQSI